jgi:hypothetical protein
VPMRPTGTQQGPDRDPTGGGGGGGGHDCTQAQQTKRGTLALQLVCTHMSRQGRPLRHAAPGNNARVVSPARAQLCFLAVTRHRLLLDANGRGWLEGYLHAQSQAQAALQHTAQPAVGAGSYRFALLHSFTRCVRAQDVGVRHCRLAGIGTHL